MAKCEQHPRHCLAAGCDEFLVLQLCKLLWFEASSFRVTESGVGGEVIAGHILGLEHIASNLYDECRHYIATWLAEKC